jgi:PST family polysaccharide transporter
LRELPRTAIFILFGTAIETISAYLLGPSGIGLIGQVNNYYGIGSTLAEVGLLIGITRFVAEAKQREDNDQIRSIITTSFIFSSILALILIVFSWIFAKQLSGWFLGSNSLYSFIWIAAPGLIFSSLYRKCDSVFQGLRDVQNITLARILLAILIPFIEIGFVKMWGLTGAVISAMLQQVVAGGIVFYFLMRSMRNIGIKVSSIHFDWQILKQMLKIGVSTMAVGLLISMTTTLVRSRIVNQVGLDGAGLFQVAWSLIFMMTSMTMSTLAYYTFPKISASTIDHDRIDVMNESIAFGISLVVAGSLFLIVPRELVITTLFRNDFSSAAPLLSLIAIGAIFFISNWVVGTPLVPKGRLFALVILNAIPSGLFVLLNSIFLHEFGLLGVSLAFIIAYAIGLSVNLYDEYRSIRFKLSIENSALIIFSIVIIFVQNLIIRSDLWSIGLRILLACGWFMFMFLMTKRYFSWDRAISWLITRIRP